MGLEQDQLKPITLALVVYVLLNLDNRLYQILLNLDQPWVAKMLQFCTPSTVALVVNLASLVCNWQFCNLFSSDLLHKTITASMSSTLFKYYYCYYFYMQTITVTILLVEHKINLLSSVTGVQVSLQVIMHTTMLYGVLCIFC